MRGGILETDNNLTVYHELAQNTEEWYEARRGIVTASEVHKLLTSKGAVATNQTSRAYIAELAAERITGQVEPFYETWDMQRGHTEEVYARQAYEEHHAPVTEVGFMTRDLGDGVLLGYSPDGLVDPVGSIEIKSRKARIQISTIFNGVPNSNMPQLQAGLVVSGRQWIDYCSYSNGMPFWTHRVYPDRRWANNIIEAVKHAEQAIQNLITEYETRVQGLPVMEWRDYDQELEIF